MKLTSPRLYAAIYFGASVLRSYQNNFLEFFKIVDWSNIDRLQIFFPSTCLIFVAYRLNTRSMGVLSLSKPFLTFQTPVSSELQFFVIVSNCWLAFAGFQLSTIRGWIQLLFYPLIFFKFSIASFQIIVVKVFQQIHRIFPVVDHLMPFRFLLAFKF